jgi:predicted RNase H-like HicB family nuclease
MATAKRTAKKKKTMKYFAVFEPAVEGGYNVSFPDFPGCVTFGRNAREAHRMAREALELWIEELAAQGKRLHKPLRRPLVGEVAITA